MRQALEPNFWGYGDAMTLTPPISIRTLNPEREVDSVGFGDGFADRAMKHRVG